MEQPTKRLTRSRTDRVLAGVCGGIAEYFRIDPTLVRIVAVLLVFWEGWLLLIYFILWWVVPESDQSASGDDRVKQVAQDVQDTAQRVAGSLTSERSRGLGRYIIGAVLVLIGVSALIRPYLAWDFWRWDIAWPALIMLVGIVIIFRRT